MTKRRTTNPESHKLADKKARGETRHVNQHFEHEHKATPIQAKNDFQKRVLKALQNKQIVVVIAPAGTGKTHLTIGSASDWLMKGLIDKIYLSRVAVVMGKTVGYLKGDEISKSAVFVAPMVEAFKERYGTGKYESALHAGNIEIILTEHLRGRNFKGVAVLDECQNLTKEEMFSIITRVTEEGKLFLLGDPAQHDLKGENGLTWLKKFVEKHQLQEYIEIVEGTSEDIVRSGVCKAFVQAMEKENNK